MTFLSLFSGIGAPEVAWTKLGWTPLAFAEIEPFPCAVLAHHFPNIPNHGDVTAFDWSVYRDRCDVLVGGSPCQSFSVAGLRKSLADDRGNLALAFCKITHAINPRYVVYENVPGILSTKDNAFGCLIAGLVGEDDELSPPAYLGGWPDAGVIAGPRRTAAWRIIDAQFHGVAQRRRRVFVLSVRGFRNWTCAEALLPLADGVPWDIAPRRETGTRVAASLTRGADSSSRGGYAGRRREDDINLIANCLDRHMGSGGPDDNAAQANHLVPELSRCLNAGGMGRQDYGTESLIPVIDSEVAHSLRAEGFDASEDGTGGGTPLVPVCYRTSGNCGVMEQGDLSAALTTSTEPNAQIVGMPIPILEVGKGTSSRGDGPNGCGIGSEGDPMFTLQAGAQHAIAFDTTQITSDKNFSSPQPGDPCHPLASGAHAPAVAFQERGREGGRSIESQDDLAYSLNAPAGGGRRQEMNVATRMAVRRLTPMECERLQGFADSYTDVEFRGKRAADGPRYRALGNAMCVNVLRWIGQRIESVDAILQKAVRP